MNSDLSSLVIVEDNAADMIHYLRLLEGVEHGFEHIECVSTLQGAADVLENSASHACCLLDFHLPDGCALSLLESFLADNKSVNCPIIVITGQENTKNAVRLLKLGVQDYLIKDDLTSHTLIRTIQNAIKNWQLTKQLEKMALYDSLTGLTNRGLFVEKLEQTFNESVRYKRHFSLLLIDLDHFKSINDIYGHQAGDFILQVVSKKLISMIRITDTASRLGGDEFAVILPEIDDQCSTKVAENIVSGLTLDVVWNNSVIPITASIGVATYPSRAQDYKKLMREADVALYRAKEKGRGQYDSYKDISNSVEDEKELLKDIFLATLLEGKLQVAFQPIVSTKDTSNVFAIEALTRWNHDGKWINPIEIINLVMELGLDIEFHEWLFTQSFSVLSKFQEEKQDLKLCLNLPANVCHNSQFIDLLIMLSAEHQISPQNVILEVTETHLMTQPDKAKERLQNLVDSGFQIAIDDFGTGYSSMEYIADLPCTILKIDKKFFIDMPRNQRNVKIIEAIAGMAHGLGMSVIAEGIESVVLSEAALELKCDYLQGFYTGNPIITDADFKTYLKQSLE